jgi:polyphosphate kinase 2 (PPK2 family)
VVAQVLAPHRPADEQLRRFKERETISYKTVEDSHAEDWRNREKWDDYGAAVDEMVARTSTAAAPWTLVEGNDKKYTRIKVMDTVCEALRRGLKSS